ncbi:MAG: lipoyl synthase [Nitrospiraceae bacterium]
MHNASRMSFIPVTQLRPVDASPSPGTDSDPSDLLRPRRLPWFRVRLADSARITTTFARRWIGSSSTRTVRKRVAPTWECWNARTATFLILGDICTRRCHYCSVATGRPHAVDSEEPLRVAEAVQALNLRHAVVTSVNRDELEDGGASVFAETIRQIRRLIPTCSVEVLIPDFEGNEAALTLVAAERPDILNHNIETVRRLFPTIRPQGKYQRSIELLRQAKRMGMTTKSGLIVGMGESIEEVREVMRDLRAVDCDIMTIGQYLQPTKEHLPVACFYLPDEFAALKEEGLALGFRHVESGPLVRSSYHAEQQVPGC